MDVISYTAVRAKLAETDYLLSSPKNAARLGKAVRDLKAGRGRQHKLIR